MRKEYDAHKEPFDQFAASLTTGDTALISAPLVYGQGLNRLLEQIRTLLDKGVVVRTVDMPQLDELLRSDREAAAQLASLGVALKRRSGIDLYATQQQTTTTPTTTAGQQKHKLIQRTLEVHRLVSQEQLSVVDACRRVGLRPTIYYLNRNKVKHLF